jgi:chromosome partitioning protein
MIITIGGIKGGSGKTTVATHLAVLRSLDGHDVLLIDADDQETASDFTLLRNERTAGRAGYTSIKLTDPAVRTETLRLRDKYEDLLIDTGGRDTQSQRAALSVSDVLLVPFVPRSFDVWTLEKVTDLVSEMQVANPNLKAFTFLNRADARGQDNGEAAQVLRHSEYLAFMDYLCITIPPAPKQRRHRGFHGVAIGSGSEGVGGRGGTIAYRGCRSFVGSAGRVISEVQGQEDCKR